jgi:hypothetical protein
LIIQQRKSMNIPILKPLGLLLIITALNSLQAQTVSAPPLTISNTGTGAVDFEYRSTGVLIARGGTGAILSSDNQSGPQFLWYPAKAAFLEGNFNSMVDANIGTYSTALGGTASGSNSLSQGYSVASGPNSVALINSTASGWLSFASGYACNATGQMSTAMGYDSSAAYGSTGIGILSLATGYDCTALGGGTSTGAFSVAIGIGTTAISNSSLAMGNGTVSGGDNTTAMGSYTTATSYDSFAIGTYNVAGGNWQTWVATDPLFEIGNGTSSSAKSDAFVVYKNGNAALKGSLTVVASGDIPMYTGN